MYNTADNRSCTRLPRFGQDDKSQAVTLTLKLVHCCPAPAKHEVSHLPFAQQVKHAAADLTHDKCRG